MTQRHANPNPRNQSRGRFTHCMVNKASPPRGGAMVAEALINGTATIIGCHRDGEMSPESGFMEFAWLVGCNTAEPPAAKS